MAEEKYFEIKIPEGATASKLAKEYKTDLDTIKRLNPQIKNLDFIRAGDMMKLPKPKLSEDYTKRLESGIERLYKGEYGIDGARERLGNELVKLYPELDVWKDIYTKIPDQWEKIAFPEKTVTTPEDLPEIKKSAWEQVGSFISEKVVEPVQEKVKSAAWDFFRKVPDIPSPEQVFEKAKTAVGLTVVRPLKEATKPIAESFQKLIDRAKELPEFVKTSLEEAPRPEIIIKQAIEKEFEKRREIWKEEFPKELQEMKESLPFIGKALKESKIILEQSDVGMKAAEQGKDLPTSIYSPDAAIAKGYYDKTKDMLMDRVSEFGDIGIVLEENESGFVYINEEKSREAWEKIQVDLFSDYQNVFPDSDPVISLGFQKLGDLQNAKTSLVSSIVTGLNSLRNEILQPGAKTNNDIKDVLSDLDGIIQSSSYLEAIDPTLQTLEDDMERFNRSFENIEDYYEKNTEGWWKDLTSIIGKDVVELLKKSGGMSADEEKIYNDRLLSLSENQISNVFTLIKNIGQSQVFENLQNNIDGILDNPEFLKKLKVVFESKGEQYSKELQAVNIILDSQDWLKENENKIRDGFIAQLSDASTEEDFKSIRNNVENNTAISAAQKDAALKVVSFFEDSFKLNNELIEINQKLAKAAEIWAKAERLDILKKEKEEVEKTKKMLSMSTFQLWAFPVTKATAADYFKALEWSFKEIGDKDISVSYPTKWVEDPWTLPSGKKIKVLLPAGIKKKWKVSNLISKIWDDSQKFEQKWVQGMFLPFVFSTADTISEALKYVGTGDILAQRISGAEKEKDFDLIRLQALRQAMNLPVNSQIPGNPSLKDILLYFPNFFNETYEYYSSPKAYEEIEIKEDTKIELVNGKVKIGGYEFDNLKTREKLYLFNPHLKDSRIIPAGTVITIPRYNPYPGLLDFVSDQERYDAYKKNFGLAYTFDQILPYMVFQVDPVDIIEGSLKVGSVIGASKWANKLGDKIGMKALSKIKNATEGIDSASKFEKLQDFVTDMYGLMAFKGADWSLGQGALAKQVKLSVDKFRAIVAQTTILKSLPESSQVAAQTFLTNYRNETKMANLAVDADKAIIEAMDKFNISNRRSFENAILEAIFDPEVIPNQSVREVFSRFGITTFDLQNWAEARPFLKDQADYLHQVMMDSYHLRSKLAFKTQFEALDKKAQDFFMYVWKDWTETPLAERIIKSDADLERVKDEFLKQFINKDEARKSIKDADRLLRMFMEEHEVGRLIGEQGKVIARLPDGTELFIPDDPSKLKNKIVSTWVDGKQRIIYDPNRFVNREFGVWNWIMEDFFGKRLTRFKDARYANVGNKLVRTVTDEEVIFSYQEINRAGKVIKGEILTSEDWIKKLGQERFVQRLKNGDFFNVAKKVKKTTAQRVFKKEQPSLKLWDALQSDFYQNFLKRDVEGIEDIKKFLQEISPKGGRIEQKIITTSADWTERIEIKQLDKGYTPWVQKTVDKVTRTSVISNESLEFFFKRAASLDLLKETDSGKRFLARYKNYLEVLPEKYQTNITKLDKLLLKTFLSDNILSDFSISLLLLDKLTPSQFTKLYKTLEKFATKASDEFYNAVKGYWKQLKKRESIEKFKEMLPKNILETAISEIQDTFKVGLREEEFNTIIPKIFGHVERIRKPEEEIKEGIETVLERAIKRTKDNLLKLKTANAKEIILRYKEISKELELIKQRKAQKLFDLSIERLNNEFDLLYKITEANAFKPADLIELLETLPRRPGPGRMFPSQVWHRLTLNISQKLAKTDLGKSILKRLGDLKEKEVNDFLEKFWEPADKAMKRRLAEDFGLSEWKEGDSMPYRIISENIPKTRPDEFYQMIYENMAALKDFLESEGLEIMLEGSKVKGVRKISGFKKAVEEKKLLGYLDKLDTKISDSVENVLQKFSDLLHIETYKDPKAFQDYVRKLEDIKVNDNLKVVMEVEIEELSNKIKVLKQKLRAASERVQVIKAKGSKKLSEALKKAAQRAADYAAELQTKQLELRKLEDNLDKLEQRIFDQERGLDAVLARVGNPLFPADNYHSTLINFLSGKSKFDLDFFEELQGKILMKKKSFDSIEKVIEEQKRLGKPFEDLAVDRVRIMHDLGELEELKKVLPDLRKLQQAGFNLSWQDLYDFGHGKISKTLKKNIDKFDEILKTPTGKPLSPIPLNREDLRIYQSLPEVQAQVNKLKIKDWPLEKYFKEWLGDDFASPEYVLPILRGFEAPDSLSKTLEAFDQWSKKGVRVVVDLTGELSKEPYASYDKAFRIVSLPELSYKAVPNVSSLNTIPSKKEIDGILELRKIFLEGKNVLIWDWDYQRTKKIIDRLTESLGENAAKTMKAAQEMFFSQMEIAGKKGVFGKTFRYPRRMDEYIKVFGGDPEEVGKITTRALTPEEAVERAIRPYEIDAAYLNLKATAQKGDLVPIGLYELGDLTERVPTLVIVAENYKSISKKALLRLKEAYEKQKAQIILPKVLSVGENIVKEFLEGENIPFKQLTVKLDPEVFLDPAKNYALSKKYPAFVYPVGRAFGTERKTFYESAKKGFRLFKPKAELEKEIFNMIDSDVKEWIRDSTKYVPKFIQDEVWAMRKNPKTLLAKWKIALNRANAKDYWKKTMKKSFDQEIAKMSERILKETGSKALSPGQIRWLTKQRKRWENAADLMEYVFDWDKPPSFWERIQKRLSKALELKYIKDQNVYEFANFPLTGFDKIVIEKNWIEGLKKFSMAGKQVLQAIPTGLGYLRTLWIMCVLYWRPAWHIKNSFDDGLRGALAARSVDYFLKTQAMFYGTSASFMRKFAGDLANVPSFFWKPTSEFMMQIEDLQGPQTGKKIADWLREQFERSGRAPYDIWDIDRALEVSKKSFWADINDKVWRDELKKMISFDELLEKGPIETPKGEWLTKDIRDYMSASGFLQTTSDPVYLRKQISLMSEAGMFNRLKKRLAVVQADIEVFAGFTENMRRQLLVHDLIFKNAMSIAQAKNKAWGYLFNYDDLTVVGKVFRYFFPFYAFNANSISLFFKVLAEGGPNTIMAAKLFLDAWSKSTAELPEWARDRIPIGNNYYWYPWSSLVQVLGFFKDPVEKLKNFADNPLEVPLGLGWDPFISNLIKTSREDKQFDIQEEILAQTGWTEAEIDKYIEDQKLKRDISGKDDWMELLISYVPFVKAIKSLTEIDMHMLVDGVSLWRSKKVREFAKMFGVNILVWNDIDKFRTLYFDSPPYLRKEIQKQIKAENPLAWEALRNYWAKTAFIKSEREAKENPVEATAKLQLEGWKFTYYDLFDKDPVKAKLWLEKNPEAREALEQYWNERNEGLPWKMIEESEYNINSLATEIRAFADKIFEKDVFDRAVVLGIEIPFGVPGSRQEFLDMFFDARGNLKITTLVELEKILGKSWAEKIINNTKKSWQEIIKDETKVRYHQWLMEQKQAETPEDQAFAKRMKYWQAILPDNIGELSDSASQKYWKAYWDYFENQFTEDQKTRYWTSLKERHGEWFYEYRMKMREYTQIWASLFERFEDEDFQFFDEFYSKPEWFRKIYFLANPNKEKWYPVAQEWTSMLSEIKKIEEETGIFQEDLRKKASEFFWVNEEIVRDYWDKDSKKIYGHGFYDYMKTWQKIIAVSETNPELYFDTFYSQPIWFREYFFSRRGNEDKRIYYPFVAKWTELIREDKKNWDENGVRTTLAKDYFWSAENKAKRELYGKNKMITKEKSVLDYLKLWDAIFILSEDNAESYFDTFNSQPEWFRNHFFAMNPNKKIYYSVIEKWVKLIKQDKENLENGEKTSLAKDFYLKEIKGKASIRMAWEAENPGIIGYLDTWANIIAQTESNPESYFDLFYSQPEEFRKRFFRNNKEKEIYYPKVRQWVQAIKVDKANLEKGIKSHIARDYFNSWKNTEAGKAYAKDNMITTNESIIDYIEIWQEIMEYTEENPSEYFSIFDSKPEWFKEHFYKNNPLKKDYYWFAAELATKPSEEFGSYFWTKGAKFDKAREAWNKDKPGFLNYMEFWKKLSNFASLGQWDLYFSFYFADKNKEFRERHQKNNPDAEQRFKLMMEYQELPSMSWEDRKAKRQFISDHPELLEWWSKDLSVEEAEVRGRLEEYYSLLDNVPEDGSGRDYFIEVRKWEVAAKKFMEDNPDVMLYLQKNSKKYTGEKAQIYSKVEYYFSIEMPEDRSKYLDSNPDVKEYLRNLKAPGIRKILDLQEQYFKLKDSLKPGFLLLHPELVDYWDVQKLPWSFFNDPKKIKPYLNLIDDIERMNKLYVSGKWTEAEALRKLLPSFYISIGASEEDEWLKAKAYSMAMGTWINLINKNEFFSIYYFRQLPRWLRDMYYDKHPEKKYLSKEPLSRFIEEPLRLWEYLNPELGKAYKLLYKYGRNLPAKYEDEVRKTMIKFGVWDERADWTRTDWQRYWEDRALKLNEVSRFDMNNLPLLRKEVEKVKKNYPLKLISKPFTVPRVITVHPIF